MTVSNIIIDNIIKVQALIQAEIGAMQVNRSKIVIFNNSQREEIGRGVTARELVDWIGLKIFRVSW